MEHRWSKSLSSVGAGEVELLREAIAGASFAPGDAGYEAARTIWNGAIDRRPELIIRCADAGDVMRVIAFAREHDVTASIRSGGHSVAGDALCEDGIVIDMSEMRSVRIDADRRLAITGAGATWGDLDGAAAEHGLAVTGGQISTTGVAGLTLGGGLGWLMREHGLTVDQLVSVEVVTYDGDLLDVGADDHPELFWALRGGGGNFGVATSFTFRLQPVDHVLAGTLVYPSDRVVDVLTAFRALTSDAPRELTLMIYFLPAMASDLLPPHLSGEPVVSIAVFWTGDPLEGRRLVEEGLEPAGEPLASTLGETRYVDFQRAFDFSAPFGLGAYWKSRYLTHLDDGASDVIAERASRMTSPLSQVLLTQMGGAVADASDDATACGFRTSAFVVEILAKWEPSESPEQIERHELWAQDTWSALEPWSNGGVYVNFLGDEPDRVKDAYPQRTLDRLRRVKATYDPENFFHHNRNIRPAG